MPIDYSRYPPNWKTEIVPAVLERAGNCCEECGLKNKQIIYAIKLYVRSDGGRYKLQSIWFQNEQDALRESGGKYRNVKVVLTIAHLDHDEENMLIELERLKALCQLCHLRYDAKEKYRRSQQKWRQTKHEEK